MADMAQAITTGVIGIAGAAVGSGLTYWLGALNRRHQEAREDATRWYERRAEAYAQFYNAIDEAWILTARKERPTQSEREQLSRALVSTLSVSGLSAHPRPKISR
jgi:hypothetical protein